MSAPDPMAHIRAEIMAQPEAERAEYALDLLAFYLDPMPLFFEGCAALGLRLPPADLRMLFALDRRRARFVSIDGLLAARCLDRPVDEWATPDKVVKSVALIRRRLAAQALPVTITNWHGMGYALSAPPGWQFEDAAPGADLVAPARRWAAQ